MSDFSFKNITIKLEFLENNKELQIFKNHDKNTKKQKQIGSFYFSNFSLVYERFLAIFCIKSHKKINLLYLFTYKILRHMKAFGAVKKKVQKLFNSKDQTNKKDQKKLKTGEKIQVIYIPPIIIDDITFSTQDLSSEKDISKMQKKLLQLYDKKYLYNYYQNRLCLEVIEEKHFFKIRKTTQKFYNHNKKGKFVPSEYCQLLQYAYSDPVLMKHFWSIDFCRLKVMNLSQHKLVSIEGLAFVSLPNLICLQIHSNNITSIDCLSKAQMPKLKTLTLYKTNIMTGQKLSRAKLPQLKDIELDTQKQNSQNKIQNMTFIFKLEKQKLKKIYAQDTNRIMNRRLVGQLMSCCSAIGILPGNFIYEYSNLRLHLNRSLWQSNPPFDYYYPEQMQYRD